MAGEDFFFFFLFETRGVCGDTFGIVGNAEGNFAGREIKKVGERLIGEELGEFQAATEAINDGCDRGGWIAR